MLELISEMISELTLLTKKEQSAICQAFADSVIYEDAGECTIELLIVERLLELPGGYISDAISHRE
ncbi:hypothetical protein K0T92_15680 [Paenibacillus oenotherae]|uniref:Uncharacterized protein n=1 Tax=Paenibacillus oenotherae TaxID=1435645 RepID=A0ABS7D8S1_9BACL|nr:hypothetical protein [Paenibacillus oenotherae]MBW7476184.1 hypothetical protein [Paenibacillus oenotherae]